ncbi:MAG: extracellular solute-binding protein [Deltaproteobacteria bacterium]|nr:extracellular solute-binding protein [Deltaproteobacteria bacterium]
MIKLRKNCLISLVAFAVVIQIRTSAYAQAANLDAAKKEGRVVVYGTVVPQVMNVIHRAFEKKYAIKIEYWRGSATQVVDRAVTERRAGKPAFDVTEASGAGTILMKREGLFARYVPPSSERFPDFVKEKDALTTAWRALPIGILYNTDLVKAAETPKTWDDLLNAKWKKKISMPDPTRHATTTQFLWNLQKLKGEKWLDYVRALARQEPHLVESLAPVANVIIRGEADVGIAYIKYVKQYKGPIAYAMMDKFISEPSYISLSGKAPNPEAGKLYMEYLCSGEGQKAVAEDGEFVFFPGIYPPIKDAEKVVPNMVFTDNPSGEELKKLITEFRKIFFSK